MSERCTFCHEEIDGEPHWPHLDGCPRREAEYLDREFVTCTCDTPMACAACCGCETGAAPGQLAIAVEVLVPDLHLGSDGTITVLGGAR